MTTFLKLIHQRIHQAVALDFGTSLVRLEVVGNPRILEEPNVIALPKASRLLPIWGSEAKDMIGRVAENFSIFTPVQRGVLSYIDESRKFITLLFQHSLKQAFIFRPTVIVAVPRDASPIERRALQRVILDAGARKVYSIDQPVAAAIGAGVPVAQSSGNIVLHLGAGICEAVIISMGGVVFSLSKRFGGLDFDYALVQYLKNQHGLQISQQTAEQLKKTVGLDGKDYPDLLVRGSDLIHSRPRQLNLPGSEISQVLQHQVNKIQQFIERLFVDIPAELSADVLDKGVLMTGGLSQLKGLDSLLAQRLNVPFTVAEQADRNVIHGLMIALKHVEAYQESILSEQ